MAGMTVGSSLFVPMLTSLAELLPHDDVLAPEELSTLSAGIVARPDLWRPLVRIDRERRRYELLYEDEHTDVWVISWMPGHATGFHDHWVSSVGLCVAEGTVREDQMRFGAPAIERTLTPTQTRSGGHSYIHRIQHVAGAPAVTVHSYSPRLDWIGQYRLDDDGTVRREIEPGRNELRDQLAAEGALVRF
ncbi:MAG: hypothetical protein EXQ77_00995 [Thermoleophilia bacterium]|nr:hypothetical protein [Thermoleophilia bacterium]